MPDAKTIALFFLSGLALLLIPGPVVLYTVARSLHQGRQAGFVSVLSAGTGDMVHVMAATVGLSAILLTSSLAFNIVKYAGAVYLIYLGIRTLTSHHEPLNIAVQPMKLSRIYSQGLLVSVLNPKTALFFLAFLPQFVDPTRGSIAAQTLLLGTMFVVTGLVTNSGYALLASYTANWLRGNRQFAITQRYVAGVVYIGLGLTAALAGGERSR